MRSDLIEAGLNEAAWLLLWGKRGGQRCDGGASVRRWPQERMEQRGAAESENGRCAAMPAMDGVDGGLVVEGNRGDRRRQRLVEDLNLQTDDARSFRYFS